MIVRHGFCTRHICRLFLDYAICVTRQFFCTGFDGALPVATVHVVVLAAPLLCSLQI
jgi:hypothetical protein